jgi:hypothetical protein
MRTDRSPATERFVLMPPAELRGAVPARVTMADASDTLDDTARHLVLAPEAVPLGALGIQPRAHMSVGAVTTRGVIQLARAELRWTHQTLQIVDTRDDKAIDLPGARLDRDLLRSAFDNETDTVQLESTRTFLGRCGDHLSVRDTRETSARRWTNVSGSAATYDVTTGKQVQLSALFSEEQRRRIFAALVHVVRRRGDRALRAAAEALARGNDTHGFAVGTRAGSGEPSLRIAVQVGVARNGPSGQFTSMTPTLIDVPWPA